MKGSGLYNLAICPFHYMLPHCTQVMSFNLDFHKPSIRPLVAAKDGTAQGVKSF